MHLPESPEGLLRLLVATVFFMISAKCDTRCCDEISKLSLSTLLLINQTVFFYNRVFYHEAVRKDVFVYLS